MSVSFPNSPQGVHRLLMHLGRSFPWRSFGVVALLSLSGLAEGIGMLSLLPLLSLADQGNAQSGVADDVTRVIRDLGITPSLGVLLNMIVIGLAVKGLLLLLAVRQAGYLGSDIAQQLRLRLVDALTSAKWPYFTSKSIGSLTNAIGTETIRASQVAVEGGYLLAASIQVAVYLALAVVVSWKLTLAAIAFGAFLFLVLHRVVNMARDAAKKEADTLRSLNSRLGDELAMIKPLKAMGREGSLRPVLAADAAKLSHAQRRQALSRALLPAIQEPLIAGVLALGLFAALTFTEAVFDELVFLALAFYRIATRLGNSQGFYQSVLTLEPSYWSVHQIIEEAEKAREINPGNISPILRRSIRIQNLTFSYGDKAVLRGFSMDIPALTLTAVTGASGVGKTSLVDLIVGLLQPSQGEISIDGTPMSEIDMGAWRAKIGYVPQETVLVHQSIYTNVTTGDKAISRDAAESALRQAGAWDFVEALPDGIETIVGERGSQLSGGQRQRVAIARALVRNPSLLILDEATASLDPETEMEICRTLEALKGHVTMLAITHQSALTRIADNVFRLTSPHAETARI